MRANEAKAVLNRHTDGLTDKSSSSSTPTTAPANPALNEQSYWAGVSENMANTQRSKAYLRAYLEIAGDMPIFGTGIRLDKGRMPLDKSVMHRLEREELVEFGKVGGELIFILTPKGQKWIEQE
jgi:hypothetical protein